MQKLRVFFLKFVKFTVVFEGEMLEVDIVDLMLLVIVATFRHNGSNKV